MGSISAGLTSLATASTEFTTGSVIADAGFDFVGTAVSTIAAALGLGGGIIGSAGLI